MDHKSDLITPDELVDRYRGTVSKRTLANWRSLREGPPYTKVGGRVMYSLSSVEGWERSRQMCTVKARSA